MNAVLPPIAHPSRRTVVRGAAVGGAAWAAPIVVGVAALPATAASLQPAPTNAVIVWNNTTVDGDRAQLRGNFGVRCSYPAQMAVITVTIAVTDSSGQTAAPTQSFTSPSAVEGWNGVPFSFSGLTAGKTYTVTFIATGVLTQFVNQTTWQSETGQWQLAPITATQTWLS